MPRAVCPPQPMGKAAERCLCAFQVSPAQLEKCSAHRANHSYFSSLLLLFTSQLQQGSSVSCSQGPCFSNKHNCCSCPGSIQGSGVWGFLSPPNSSKKDFKRH